MVLEKNGRTFDLYDSIKNMPAGRLMQFQVQLVQHNAMGSTFDELDARNERLDMFLAAGRVEDAMQERQNQMMGFYAMFENINTATVALANLVKAIDGVPVTVRTDEDMMQVARILESTDISQEEVEEVIESVKKKVDAELQRYVPEMFNDRLDIDHIANVIREAQLKAELELGNESKRADWLEARRLVLDAVAPVSFDPNYEKNYQVEAERSFISLCAILGREGVVNAEEVPALNFYVNVQLLKKKNEPKNKVARDAGWDEKLATYGH